MPNFSEGDAFLAQVRGKIGRRRQRVNLVSLGSTLILAVGLFTGSFSALQEQKYSDYWASYLLSEMSFEDVGEQTLADAELYLNMLMEDDFDELLSGIYDLGLQEDLVFAYSEVGQ